MEHVTGVGKQAHVLERQQSQGGKLTFLHRTAGVFYWLAKVNILLLVQSNPCLLCMSNGACPPSVMSERQSLQEQERV